jgi:hypothetical protein
LRNTLNRFVYSLRVLFREDSAMTPYGRWLGFLARSEPSVLAVDPVERLTEYGLARYLGHLGETAGTVGRHMFLAKLRDAIRVMFPGKVPPHLSRLVARLERECQPRSMAARVVTTQRLTFLSKELMRHATGAAGEVTDIVTYRDGLMIGFLASRPVRRRTFSLMRLRRHLCRVGDEWRIIFEGLETKSGRPFVASVPEWSGPFLARYLLEVRPRFSGTDRHDGLWVSTKGRPLTDKAIYCIITDRTRAAFGQPVNPHLFRACAATTVAILDPARIGIARDLLSHGSIATTHTYYNKASSIEASRLYANVLAGLTRRGPRLGAQVAPSDRRRARRRGKAHHPQDRNDRETCAPIRAR